MHRAQNLCWGIICGMGLACAGLPVLQADEKQREDPDWGDAMVAVHARFKGERGTFAHFGDSITVSMAFWSPLQDEPKEMSPAAARSYRRVKDYMSADCWSKWKGPEFGNEGSMTIRWAHQNIDVWLKRLNPEVALIMFGTNDLRQLELEEYKQKTREVVRRCLKNGTIVILNTIPPRSGMLKESRMYAEAAAAIAREEQVPLVDYFGEVLRRRPDDWDGMLKKFGDAPGDDYQVPTLVSRDGVHPSNSRSHVANFSQEALNNNGYGLRSYLVLLAYSRVIERVLDPKAKAQEADPRKTDNDAKLVQGKWRVISAEANGSGIDVSLPKVKIEKMTVLIEKDEIRVVVEGTKSEQGAKFTIDPSTSPKQIDFTKETRDSEWSEQLPSKLFRGWKMDGKLNPILAEDKVQGIYKLEGDTLTLCWRTTPEKENVKGRVSNELKVRPTVFQSHLYYQQFLFVLARDKAEK